MQQTSMETTGTCQEDRNSSPEEMLLVKSSPSEKAGNGQEDTQMLGIRTGQGRAYLWAQLQGARLVCISMRLSKEFRCV